MEGLSNSTSVLVFASMLMKCTWDAAVQFLKEVSEKTFHPFTKGKGLLES